MKRLSSSVSKVLFSLLVAFLLCNASTHELAFAGGGQAYPNGAEAFMVGAAPPPGLTILNYVYFYTADRIKNGSGHDAGTLDRLNIWAEVARLIWISKQKVLGANYGQHAFFLLANVDMHLKHPAGTRLKKRYRDTDVPYLIWSPCLLTWHLMSGKLHMVLDAADIYVPLYNEDTDNLASLGRNYWTIEPVFAVTWLPNASWELSAKFMYDFNSRQEDYQPGPPVKIDRTPGQEFHVDFNTSYAMSDGLRIGLSGYYYRQVKNDDYHHLDRFQAPLRDVLKALEGKQSQVWALGPGIWYHKKNLMASLRSQWEFRARNKSQGGNAWFKLTYCF